ncbi:MAG: glycosyltransferase family 39 protein [Geothrix sp.]|uniref:ArnT family glycosyltransferase n=1 Tax=Geothrix sp. TaxID=1962974 RepID=UPI0018327D1A|nr:glycosyltransferase family 39 protein [Geothrix sp.]NWJ39452.1 glycosyltransferase family 39 protein [Geothrix sp.]WIL19323.1 MAG: glycosyltransferase family 39 protein [Geothrix sp.]
MDAPSPQLSSPSRLALWLRAHAPELLFALLLLAVLPMRDLWAPDEPDFAQCVKEMRLRGDWILPYLNGVPYSEKPILYYWVMKAASVLLDALTGGLGFTQGVAAWALRLPSVLAAVAFLSAFRRWAARFLEPDLAEPAALILATTPLWFWQSQFIQIDLLFSALLAWSWLCWLGGYLLLQRPGEPGQPDEPRRWFLKAYFWLALAFLAKGPLAPLLSVLVLAAFLAWQRDFTVLRRAGIVAGLAITLLLVSPWYIAAGLKGGAHYAYELIIFQNFERATRAWDHIHPWWKYGEYMLGDFFPWVLWLPALALHLRRERRLADPAKRFLLLAFVVPFVFLSLVQSKQGKYLLMGYPFLALLLADLIRGAEAARARRLGGLLAAGLALPAAALSALALGMGGAKVQAQLASFLGPLRLMALGMVAGTVFVVVQAVRGRGARLVPGAALSLGLLYLVGGTWGFRLLDPPKSYRRWTAAVQPLIAGRPVFYWQTIRSGVMVYTDHLMPELRSARALEGMDAEARLVAQRGEWEQDAWGMTPALRARFEVLLSVPTGGGEILLLRKRPNPIPEEAP